MTDIVHDLAALMCSKLCHDLVSPVGALANGLEVLEDETDGELHKEALHLIAQSAKAASIKLQFARLAYGMAGGSGGTLDLASAAAAASDYFALTKSKLNWSPGAESWPKDEVRLALNLLLIAHECIPRGGAIDVEVSGGGAARRRFLVTAEGVNAKQPERSAAALDGALSIDELDARLVQPFFTSVLANKCGARIEVTPGDGRVRIEAQI